MTDALLLMDLQNEILGRFTDSDDFLHRAVATKERAEQAGVPVVLVRVAFEPGHPEISSRNRSFAAGKQRGAMLLGDPSTDFRPELLATGGEVIVNKKRVSAFAGSHLELVLRAHGITRLALGGISTSGVVLSTVREAADRDYELLVLEDLCLDTDDEVHRVLTQKVFPRQADVIASADWTPIS